jgi:hypothetical protein
MTPSQKLAQAFRRAGDEAEAQKAEAGYYGDFTSPLAAPQTTLYHVASAKGYEEIRTGVLNGEYDG